MTCLKEPDIIRLEECFDTYILYNECRDLMKKTNNEEQIGLTHTKNCPEKDKWTQAYGSLYENSKDRYISSADFKVFNQALSGTYLQKVYERINQKYGPVGRSRLMSLSPSRCYATHVDLEKRIHIAINTSEECYFVFENQRLGFIPADGHPYLVNTLLRHTFVNANGKYFKPLTRIHLIFEQVLDSHCDSRS